MDGQNKGFQTRRNQETMAHTKTAPNAEEIGKAIRENRQKMLEDVKRQEDLAQRDPQAYRKKVRRLVTLGYAYVVGVVVLLVVVLVGVLAFLISRRGTGGYLIAKLLIFIVPLGWAVLRSLFVKLPQPEGVEVTRESAPQLWKDVDDLAARIPGLKIDRILLTDELNAAAAQRPRFGLVGPSVNLLLLGLPNLLTMTQAETRGVIAHELGHFAGNDGVLGGKVYRLHRMWEELQAHFEKNGGDFLFAPFFRWYQPKFEATTFALRRQQEYQADNAAAEVVGAEVYSTALLRYSYTVPHLRDQFYRPLYDKMKWQPEPPTDPMAALPKLASAPIEPDFVARNLAKVLRQKTDYDDSHPSMSDRISALKVDLGPEGEAWVPRLAAGVPESAAEAYFGNALPQILDEVNREYQVRIAADWSRVYEHYQGERTRLQELKAQAATLPLALDERLERLQLTHSLYGTEAARPQMMALLQEVPDDPRVQYGYGATLLHDEDEAGIAHLMRAQELEPAYRQQVSQLLTQFYSERGQVEEAESALDSAIDAYAQDHAYMAQADQIHYRDELKPAEVEPVHLAKLKESLLEVKNLKKAYLVEKHLPEFPDRPLRVLVVFPAYPFFQERSVTDRELFETLREMNVPITFGVKLANARQWKGKLSAMPEAKVFER
jgi:Zn-dependent protease with chaperone function